MVTPTVVDVDVDFTKKIIVTSNKHPTQNSAVQEAYYRAVKENNIDILMDPIFEVETMWTLFGSRSRATVTGFAGYYKNPRTLTKEMDDNYNKRLEQLEKMLKIKAVVDEEHKTVIISGCCGDKGTGGVTEINTTPSVIEKYMMLYGNGNAIQRNNNGDNQDNYNLNLDDKNSGGIKKILDPFGLFH